MNVLSRLWRRRALRFRQGEVVEIAKQPALEVCYLMVGDEVEIVRVGPFRPRTLASGPSFDGRPGTCGALPADYEIRDAAGAYWFCDDEDLRRRRQRQADWDFIEDITDWRPAREGQAA